MHSKEVLEKIYSKKTLKHFYAPQNQGKMEDYTVVGRSKGQSCGDDATVYLKVKDDIIVDIKFETQGCVAAIASMSVLTDMVRGEKINEALEVTKDQLIKEIDGLPEMKRHCASLGLDSLRKAIKNYKN